jgi:hypothetical protein
MLFHHGFGNVPKETYSLSKGGTPNCRSGEHMRYSWLLGRLDVTLELSTASTSKPNVISCLIASLRDERPWSAQKLSTALTSDAGKDIVMRRCLTVVLVIRRPLLLATAQFLHTLNHCDSKLGAHFTYLFEARPSNVRRRGPMAAIRIGGGTTYHADFDTAGNARSSAKGSVWNRLEKASADRSRGTYSESSRLIPVKAQLQVFAVGDRVHFPQRAGASHDSTAGSSPAAFSQRVSYQGRSILPPTAPSTILLPANVEA